MTYKHNTPTFNVNRNVVNFKDFDPKKEEAELTKLKRSFKKNDREIGPSEVKSKYNKVTRKNDTLSKAMVKDKLDAVKENVNENGVLEGWAWFYGVMHKVEFNYDKHGFNARLDNEIWDYSEDIQDFVNIVKDTIYTKTVDGEEVFSFVDPVSLQSWIDSNKI